MRLGQGLSSVLSVSALVCALAVAFPREAFRPLGPIPARQARTGSAAFVMLDQATETELLRGTRDSWRKGGGPGRIYADLLLSELPAVAKPEVLAIGTRSRTSDMPLAEADPVPFLPSLQAGAPVRTPGEPPRETQAFSREELLKID